MCKGDVTKIAAKIVPVVRFSYWMLGFQMVFLNGFSHTLLIQDNNLFATKDRWLIY
jgi:hypothetical protein